MICPMKFAQDFPEGYSNELLIANNYLKCHQGDCAWWNDRFGMCCKAVDAYLKGQEDYRAERKAERMDRRDY